MSQTSYPISHQVPHHDGGDTQWILAHIRLRLQVGLLWFSYQSGLRLGFLFHRFWSSNWPRCHHLPPCHQLYASIWYIDIRQDGISYICAYRRNVGSWAVEWAPWMHLEWAGHPQACLSEYHQRSSFIRPSRLKGYNAWRTTCHFSLHLRHWTLHTTC